MKGEWDSEGEESIIELEEQDRPPPEDLMQMDDRDNDEDLEGEGTMEDVFGPSGETDADGDLDLS